MRSASNNDPTNGDCATETKAKSESACLSSNKKSGSKSITTALAAALRYCIVILHVASFGVIAFGIYLSHAIVFHHAECDMTYSWREFFPVAVEHSTDLSSPYRLYQFFDHRDPRHREMLRTKKRDSYLSGSEGCLNPNTTTVVLYIPGHGGSYQQSRSLGAHGLQLTDGQDNRQKILMTQRALLQGDWTGTTAKTIHEFVYEVYALDFQEEGTGLHGQFIREQSDFVADAIRHLASSKSCEYTSLHIVAHSLGGYAARLALMQHSDIQPSVQSLVTLGTPHAYPVLALDSSIYNLHNSIRHDDGLGVILVSISGGLRDEMIPPESCEISKSSKSPSLSLLATSLMNPGHVEATELPSLGMDHRATVWCRNLLDEVRTILYVLTRKMSQEQGGEGQITPESMLERLHIELGIVGGYNYSKAVKDAHQTMKARLGTVSFLAVEAGFLYNAEILVKAYAFLGGIYGVFRVYDILFAGLATTVVVTVMVLDQDESTARLSNATIALITLAANSLFWMFHTGLRACSSYFRIHRRLQNRYQDMLGLFLGVCYLLLLHGHGGLRIFAICLIVVYYFVSIMAIPIAVASTDSHGPKNCQDQQSTSFMIQPGKARDDLVFATWSFPLLPLLMAGYVYASVKRPNKDIELGSSWALVMIPCARNVLARKTAQFQHDHCHSSSTMTTLLLYSVRVTILLCHMLVGRYERDIGHVAWWLVRSALVDITETLLPVLASRLEYHGHID
ncbi:hypothetical protein ACA910_011011 [Epithemia clementina (nom. ined.)]